MANGALSVFVDILTGALAVAGIAAVWILVQLLARRAGTKNLLDHRPSSCSRPDLNDRTMKIKHHEAS